MFYYSILRYNEHTGQWIEWDSASTEKEAKIAFDNLTAMGQVVKVLHCRGLSAGKNWIGN